MAAAIAQMLVLALLVLATGAMLRITVTVARDKVRRRLKAR